LSEAKDRARVVAIAKTWAGTPYKHRCKIKGVGVDCATLLAAVFEEAGLVEPAPIPPYSPQFHLNGDGQPYLTFIAARAVSIDGPPLPGDLVLWKFGRAFSHAAIVIEWPTIIHAVVSVGTFLDDGEGAWLTGMGARGTRPRRFFSYWRR
jgi:cell wall-associated NlpC family hydrolase